MEYFEKNGEVYFSTEDDFDLKKIFDCGQCFRWNENEDGSFTGVAKGRAARIRREGSSIVISGNAEDMRSVWQNYFDLDRDYRSMRRRICVDEYMAEASDFGKGIRILNQDRWETLCSFIISQCNNIPRIKKIVETMCREFGDKICFEGRDFYTFPDAETIAALSTDDLAPLRAGYRAPYIIAAAKAVSEGTVDLDLLSRGTLRDAEKTLKTLPGIGDKVANCVILFSLRIPEAFPIDVWMKKAIKAHYPDGFDPEIFGDCAGLAQQYMFYYERMKSA